MREARRTRPDEPLNGYPLTHRFPGLAYGATPGPSVLFALPYKGRADGPRGYGLAQGLAHGADATGPFEPLPCKAFERDPANCANFRARWIPETAAIGGFWRPWER
jgi:hypothetical protein